MKLCVIPARGGSKRIPGKNIRAFLGKPIIAWSIEAALNSGCFDHVIVSTDDEAIADVARSWGAEVPFVRPAELSDDFATSVDVVKHAALWWQQHHSQPDYLCCLYATAPFVTPELLKQSEQLIIGDTSLDYVFAATCYDYPVQRALMLDAQNRLHMLFPEHQLTRSQDLPECWHDAGQFYWGRYQAWVNSSAIFGAQSRFVSLDRRFAQDIDTEDDWLIAEALFRVLRE